MTGDIHPLAPHSLPPFVGAADGSDPLFSAIVFIVILAVLGVGVFYLKLHAVPEQLAHKHGNTQSQLTRFPRRRQRRPGQRPTV